MSDRPLSTDTNTPESDRLGRGRRLLLLSQITALVNSRQLEFARSVLYSHRRT
jgi:hypothetical protein